MPQCMRKGGREASCDFSPSSNLQPKCYACYVCAVSGLACCSSSQATWEGAWCVPYRYLDVSISGSIHQSKGPWQPFHILHTWEVVLVAGGSLMLSACCRASRVGRGMSWPLVSPWPRWLDTWVSHTRKQLPHQDVRLTGSDCCLAMLSKPLLCLSVSSSWWYLAYKRSGRVNFEPWFERPFLKVVPCCFFFSPRGQAVQVFSCSFVLIILRWTAMIMAPSRLESAVSYRWPMDYLTCLPCS